MPIGGMTSVGPALTIMPLVPVANMLATCPPPPVDRGGLFDGQRAKIAGVVRIDLAAGSGLQNCPGNRAARQYPAAEIGVIVGRRPGYVLPAPEPDPTIGKLRA